MHASSRTQARDLHATELEAAWKIGSVPMTTSGTAPPPEPPAHDTPFEGLAGLLEHPILASDPEALGALLGVVHPSPTPYRGRRDGPGGEATPLIRAGQPPDRIFLIRSGVVKVLNVGPDALPITLAHVGPGQWIGCAELYSRFTLQENHTNLSNIEAHRASSLASLRAEEALRDEAYRAGAGLDEANDRVDTCRATLGNIDTLLALLQTALPNMEVVPHALSVVETFHILSADLLPLLGRYVKLREWLEQLVGTGSWRPALIQRAIAANANLDGLSGVVRERALQAATIREYRAPTDRDAERRPWLPAGVRGGRVGLLLCGTGQRYLPNGDYAGAIVAGELFGDERLQDVGCFSQDTASRGWLDEPLRTLEVHLDDGALFLDWSWSTFRAILQMHSSLWRRYLSAVQRSSVQVDPPAAGITVFVGQDIDLPMSALAIGAAFSMHNEDPSLRRKICVIDSDGPFNLDSLYKGMGLTAVDDMLDDVPIQRLVRATGQPGDPGAERLSERVDVIWSTPSSNGAPFVRSDTGLLNAARLHPAYERVLLTDGRSKGAVLAALVDHATMHEATVVWATDKPHDTYAVTSEVPPDTIRIDRVNSGYERLAREAGAKVVADWAAECAPAEAPRARPNQVVRLVSDPEGARALREGRFTELLSQYQTRPLGRALRRIARAVVGRTVGLALGGGGVWGCGHIALLRQLEAAGVLIDLVAGSSFGSVVGALYAAGGMPLLERMVQVESLPPGERVQGVRATVKGSIHSPFFRAVLRGSLLTTRAIQRWLDDYIATLPGFANDLACTEIPFFPVSTNLNKAEPHLTVSGSVGFGVRAASGLPPSLPGMRYHGDRILDGAVIANVPAKVLRVHGAAFVITSNVISPSEENSVTGVTDLLYNATVQRVLDTMGALWTVIWKSGESEGDLAGDVCVNIRIKGAPLFASWQCRSIVDACNAALVKADIGATTRDHWKTEQRWGAQVHREVECVVGDGLGKAPTAQ